MGVTVILVGDCRAVMADMEADSIDAIVCDPPYELGFMGKGWDKAGVAFDPATWAACLRVLRPGAHLLAFGGTRTFHRMTVAIEDAGFEIKDCLMWLQGQGFPKHKSLLKPGWEPIILGKKRGAGVLQIDACRIGTDEDRSRPRGTFPHSDDAWGNGHLAHTESHPLGRWPANVALDEAAAAMLDAQSGERGKSYGIQRMSPATGIYGPSVQRGDPSKDGQVIGYGDTGGASRFFYVAKSSRRERNAGLEGMPERMSQEYGQYVKGRSLRDGEWVETGNESQPKANHHPTVKPIALMRWLVRLVTPPGGTVLDPFAGSGSTGCAAAFEGFDFIGIEMDPTYAEIAEKRIAYWSAQRPTVLQPALPMEGAAD